MTASRWTIPTDCLPYAHELEDVPQLSAVVFLWLALHAIERALIAAHPTLIGDDVADRDEHLAAAVLSLSSLLRVALSQYRDLVLELAEGRTSARQRTKAKTTTNERADDIPF